MKEFKEVEVFNIEIRNDGAFAYISYQNPNKIGDINNGYDHICVPMKLRPIQMSVHDNLLVDQSEKKESLSNNP
jgi:hypothetical protein